MVATELLSYIDGFSVSKYSGLEDFADRANFQGNIIVLMLSIVVVSMRQCFMHPIICFMSTLPGGRNAEEYMTNMCWIEGTVPMNFSKKVTNKDEDWKKLRQQSMNYYQWIPFVLGLQAILYYLPRLLWQLITYNRMGMDLEQLAKDANDANSEDDDTKQKIIEHIARNVELMLFEHRAIKSSNKLNRHLPGKRRGNILVSLYFLVKVMYIVIGILQLNLMYYFLRLDTKEGYRFFGYRILLDIYSDRDWSLTQVFPRVGMCRNALEQLGNTNHAFAQCLLPINMLNEKVYVFLFFFLSSVFLLTVASLPVWLYRTFSRRCHRRLVKHCLKMNGCLVELDGVTKRKVDRFVVEFLRQDGNFIVRMLSMNVGDLMTASIVTRLFEIYLGDGYTKIDLRCRHTHAVHDNELSKLNKDHGKQFMKISLEKMGCALKSTTKPSCPDEKIEFL